MAAAVALNSSTAARRIFEAHADLFETAGIIATGKPTFPLGLWPSIAIGAVLSMIILFCVVGNMFVVSAILLERDLRSRPQYYLIFSLAIADLMVGLIVTPIMAWFTLKQVWDLGVTMCDLWISMDVLVCTSSILHLVAIALDRYWSITDIYYSQKRTPRRIFTMLLVIWVVSLIISIAPIFGWKDKHFVERVQDDQICLISQAISYQVFSTATAFYIPLCAIIVVYYKIMRAAKKRFRRERDRRTISRALIDETSKSKVSFTAAQDVSISPISPSTGLAMKPFSSSPLVDDNGNCCCDSSMDASLNNTSLILNNNNNSPAAQNGHGPKGPLPKNKKFESMVAVNVSTSDEDKTIGQTTSEIVSGNVPTNSSGGRFVQNKKGSSAGGGPFSRGKLTLSGAKRLAIARTPIVGMRKRRGIKESVENRRERKAWRTLAIITGTFIACWTPFFLIALYRPICTGPSVQAIYGPGPICTGQIPPLLEFVFGWLGYLNSALNPVIYTVFSTDFRCAFERILKRLFMIK